MEDLYTTLAILSLVAFVVMLFTAASDKVVVYFDLKDLLLTMSPWVMAILTFILLHLFQHEGELNMAYLSGMQKFVHKAGVVSTIAISLYSIRKAQIYNKSFFVGFMVGVFRLVSSLIAFVVLLEQVYTLFHSKTTYREATIATMTIGIFVWMGNKLINGDRVYIKNGWDNN